MAPEGGILRRELEVTASRLSLVPGSWIDGSFDPSIHPSADLPLSGERHRVTAALPASLERASPSSALQHMRLTALVDVFAVVLGTSVGVAHRFLRGSTWHHPPRRTDRVHSLNSQTPGSMRWAAPASDLADPGDLRATSRPPATFHVVRGGRGSRGSVRRGTAGWRWVSQS